MGQPTVLINELKKNSLIQKAQLISKIDTINESSLTAQEKRLTIAPLLLQKKLNLATLPGNQRGLNIPLGAWLPYSKVNEAIVNGAPGLVTQWDYMVIMIGIEEDTNNLIPVLKFYTHDVATNISTEVEDVVGGGGGGGVPAHSTPPPSA
jgi:hypothetical protein